MKNNRVLLGLSGGVDSTAAALLLKQQGYEVIGYYFDVLGNQKEGLEKARKAAEQLGIQFVHRTVVEEFEQNVIQPFCDCYRTARTPNPCIICNPSVKFGTMLEEADRVGADWLATGHYARLAAQDGADGQRIRMAENRRKDQSYMLYRLPAKIVDRLILPLGEIDDKEKVRDLVRDFGVFNADDKDSQEICFIPDDDYVKYLEQRGIYAKEGDFIDGETGQAVGKHRGIIHYTIGQRKGLGVTFGKPRFVTKIDPLNHQVTLGSNEDLFACEVSAEDLVICGLTGQEAMEEAKRWIGKPLLGKVRYAAPPADCVIENVDDKEITIRFETPQRAITPGQSVVLYDGEILVGGGFITA
ncbi:MAG: tRNA 2-thiouridine(34) synthase MnmA [Firmicutes bacterium]|nr:tRNA 2-thiouridine(34) synthase MnmA [Bacillota bacterium]